MQSVRLFFFISKTCIVLSIFSCSGTVTNSNRASGNNEATNNSATGDTDSGTDSRDAALVEDVTDGSNFQWDSDSGFDSSSNIIDSKDQQDSESEPSETAVDTTLPPTDFEIDIQTSRTEGLAPLSVFFDVSNTPGLRDGDYLDATFLWNFDVTQTDPDSKYPTGSGFVAAHVFDKPGTYMVRLDVYDAQGRHGVESLTIVAQPFEGQTYYVASDGSDSNSGTSMDSPVATAQHALLNLANPNTQILFRKGDTFNTRLINAAGHEGPVIIASYTDPDSPSDRAPIIFSTAVDNDHGIIVMGNDWRIMDLRVRSGGSTAGHDGPRYPSGVSFSGETNNSLIYRLEKDHLAGALNVYGQYNTMAECNIHHISGGGYSSDGDGGALIGNWVHDQDDDDREHIYRLQGGTRYYFAHNNFEGAAVNFDNLTIRGNSEKVVIYKNIIDRATGIWPQNRNSAEEYQHHCVVDSNLFMGRNNPPNYTTTTPTRQIGLALSSKDIVVRNNIFYNYQFSIMVNNDDVVGPSQRISIYNNTFINITPDDYFYPITVQNGCLDVNIRNNLMLDSTEDDSKQIVFIEIRDGDGINGSSDHNLIFGDGLNSDSRLFDFLGLTQWQSNTGQDTNSMVANPLIDSIDPSDFIDNFAKPSTTSSPAVDSGETAPGVALDFYGNLRSQPPDIGAVEYSDDTHPIPWFLPTGDTAP